MFPRESSGIPCNAEPIPTNSSGEAVAIDITINATVNSFQPRNSEMFDKAFINQSPANISKKQEAIKIKINIIIIEIL